MKGEDQYIAFLRQLPTINAAEERQPRYVLSPNQPTVIGRDPHCQIVLNTMLYQMVSRRHAQVSHVSEFQSPEGIPAWQVCDLKSANGTFLNGQRLQGCQGLRQGDRLMLGQDGPVFVFEYQLVFEPPPSLESSAPTLSPRRSAHVAAAFEQTTAGGSETDSISLTQLFPIFSTGQELVRKAFLLPGGITVAFVVLLFLAVGEPIMFNLLLSAYISAAAYYFIYRLCGKHRSWWLLLGTAITTACLLLSPVLDVFIFVFRSVLPGNLPANLTVVNFPVLLLKMFFGAGLMEELFKALPVLAALFLGRKLKSPWKERLGVREPLDGILLGAASAVGFTLLETLGQYIPEIYKATLQAGEGTAQLTSLQLLIPRVLGSVAGHMAYSGYLGYFIGLSVLRPRKRWVILGVGYLTAAVLHTLWNATGVLSPVLLAVVGVLSYAFLTAAILKARELSPTRSQNFATRFYRPGRD